MHVLHLLPNERSHHVTLFFRDLEDQFVVHLQGHSGFQSTFDNRRVDSDHRHLDQIGCGALQGRIDGGSFGKAAEICILAVDIWNGPHSPEQRLNFLFAAGFVQCFIDEFAHAAVLFKIGIDESLGLGGLDAKVLR